MNKGIIAILSFITGGIVGFVLCKKVNEQDVEERIQNGVEAVKMTLSKLYEEKNAKPDDSQPEEKAVEAHERYSGKIEPEKKEQETEPARRAYRPESKTEDQLHKMASALKPRVIPPDDLGDTYGKDNVINLTYYSDGVLCGSDNQPLRDVDICMMVGEDFATHFGEYEDDSVCIINDGQRCEYEILAEERSYKQFLSEHPELRL